MTSGRMSEPWNLEQRVDREDFRRFPYEGLDVYIEEDLLSEGEIVFSIPEEGEFTVTVRRSDEE